MVYMTVTEARLHFENDAVINVLSSDVLMGVTQMMAVLLRPKEKK